MPTGMTANADGVVAEAHALFQDNQPARAETLLRALMDAQPARVEVAALLAEVQRSQGRFGAAGATWLALCRAHGFDMALSLRGAEFARQCDRHALAAEICAGALRGGAASAELLALAGHVAREAGDFELARSRFHAALDAGIDLERQHVLVALANSRRYADPADLDVQLFARHFADTAHGARARASAGFALAKVQDDLGEYGAAATTLRAANALVRGAQPWDASAWRGFVAARMQERAVASRLSHADAFIPVFIVGVPRSGTTLTATLLARACGARDRGELRALRYIAAQLIAGKHWGSAAAMAEAAGLYRMLAVQDDAPATHYLDQDPLNFRYLDIVAAMFPQARIIHCRRDPRDTALSLWCQDFAHPDMACAYTFADIADFMAGHAALMRHWQRSLPIPIHDLDYDALVAQPEATLARLGEFIGVPTAAATGAANRSGEAVPVQSASVWQARQPVYSTSVGRWKNYQPFVSELAGFG